MRSITRLAALLSFIAAVILSSWSGVTAEDKPADWKTEMLDVQIPMRDEKKLAADVYLPKKVGKYPAILIQTPYNKSNTGKAIKRTGDIGDSGRGSGSDLSIFDYDNYAYVVVDWRGFFGSKAALTSGERPRRGEDGYDCVEWIAGQEWCNGKVGTWGGSALAKQQFDTMVEQPPHLVCAAPLIAPMGFAYYDYYEGGILLEGHVEMLDKLGFGVGEIVRKFPRSDGAPWKLARQLAKGPSNIKVPCLMISGWWDNYTDRVLETFDDLCTIAGDQTNKHSRLIMGPWDHVSVGLAKQGDCDFKGAEKESGRAAMAFFDYWLRDMKDNGWDKTPRIRYWQCFEGGKGEWRSAEKWEDIKRSWKHMFLTAEGGIQADALSTRAAKEAPLTRKYTYDPLNPCPTLGGANLPPMPHGPTDQSDLGKRPDVLSYTSAAFGEPLHLNGNIELSIWFAANRKDCDLFMRVCDVGPDGKAILIAEAARRAKYRNVAYSVQELIAGDQNNTVLRCPATAYTLQKGHKLRLYISSGNYPRYERNTHTLADHWDNQSAKSVEVTVFHDKDAYADLTLPCAQ
ncbi:MAG: CocE/NonD family hydrolase [Planctomycetes bacterium]|nr:CocE/NonD family hydrolase [Planctomycetota bacterium]